MGVEAPKRSAVPKAHVGADRESSCRPSDERALLMKAGPGEAARLPQSARECSGER